MKSFLLGLISVVMITGGTIPNSALAEGGQTHGGTAIVCRTPEGAISSAEPLDLFEARELYGIRTIAVKDVATERVRMLNDLAKVYAGRSVYPNHLKKTLDAFHDRFRPLAPNVRLELIPDAFPKISKKGCAIEQLAAFQQNGEILLDSEIFGTLSPLGRLALELHESVYYLDRKWSKAKDSVFARKLVGLLLADQWGSALDRTLLAYALDVPRAGLYLNGLYGPQYCNLLITYGPANSLIVTELGACESVLPQNAFETSKTAALAPVGEDIWMWTDRDSGNRDKPYGVLMLERLDTTYIRIENVEFKWVADKLPTRTFP